MICKTRAGLMIEDVLEEASGVTNITLADIVAIDAFMKAIFDKEFRTQINGLVEQPTARDCCLHGLDSLASSEVNISIDNCEYVKEVYADILHNGTNHHLCQSITHIGADFLLKDGTADSFGMLKFHLYDKENNPFILYMLPLFAAYANYNPVGEPLALVVNGSGESEFMYIPSINGYDGGKRADVNKLMDILTDNVGFGLNVLDKFKHDQAVLISTSDYTKQIIINKGKDLSYAPITGIGVYIDESGNSLFMRLLDTEAKLDKFEPKADKLLLLYDNREYLDCIMDTEPIYVRVLADTEIDYNGLYMNSEDIEPCDEYMKYNELSTASKVGRALERGKQIPKQVIEQGRKLASKVREVLVEFRRADDDTLRERIINDEFVPLLDNSMQYLIGGATSFGLYFLVAANPLIALLGGLGAKTLKKMRDKSRREKALKMIKDEIEVIDEKIADAKNADDRAQKYALMRIKQNLEGKLLGITKSGKYVN